MTMTNETTATAARAAYDLLMFHRKYVAPHPGTGANGEDGRVYHRHHIMPKSLFPAFEKDEWNLVRLSFDEHIEAHELLVDATDGDDKIVMARALVCMTQVHRNAGGYFDVEKAEEAARLANAAHSDAQTARLKEYWSDPGYRAQKSVERSNTNRRNWSDPEYRARQAAAIAAGRKRSFADEAFKADVYRRQAEAISGKKHFRFMPVNIYRHDTSELVAEGVSLSEWCRENELSQPHMHGTISADRNRPSGRQNRTHHAGYFARAVDETGAPEGLVTPAVAPRDHGRARRADVYRYEDDSLVAANVIVRQFVKERCEGKKLNQGALSQTAYADPDLPSSRYNPHHHKGFYIEYCDDNDA